MLESIIHFSIRHRWVVMFVVMGFMALGIYNFGKLLIGEAGISDYSDCRIPIALKDIQSAIDGSFDLVIVGKSTLSGYHQVDSNAPNPATTTPRRACGRWQSISWAMTMK